MSMHRHPRVQLRTNLAALAACTAWLVATAPPARAQQDAPPAVVTVGRDDVRVRASCRIEVSVTPIADANQNGVLHITGRDDGARIVVDLGGATLAGAASRADAAALDTFTGTGIVITGRNVTLRNGAVRGFKVGILAEDCDGLILEDLDTSDNYAQRLRSTASAEDARDWLYPHRNDGREWITQHGAGIAVARARDIAIRGITSHRTQNGIVLDRVEHSRIYDNDCSFLSGWGIAMWRSSHNTVCRNSLDFCIRGYSHGVYNRGQDSAGLLMFEQCSSNTIALNSITHGGDGIFGFAGREALGEGAAEGAAAGAAEGAAAGTTDPTAAHLRKGCNDNLFFRNDLSFAAAHGLEMTFSFGNRIIGNTLEANAICGIWGGYARDTVVLDNTFARNGGAGYGAERGGINMEHGQRNHIIGNRFADEPVGVRLWTDADEHIRRLPWGAANGMGAAGNAIEDNTFTRVKTAVELLAAKDTALAANLFLDCAATVADRDSTGTATLPAPRELAADTIRAPGAELEATLPGKRPAIGLRPALRGRDRIVMQEFGPYAWDRPLVVPVGSDQVRPRFRALGFRAVHSADVVGNAPLFAGIGADGETVEVASNLTGFVAPFTVQLREKDRASKASASGVIATAAWKTRIFPLDGGDGPVLGDVPDAEGFRARAAAAKHVFVLKAIDFDFANAGPSKAVPDPDVERLAFGNDRFGLTAETTLAFRPGRWRIQVESDDGIRLWVDGALALERWDIHVPTTDTVDLTIRERRDVPLRLEYFENSGFARLRIRYEHLGPPAP